MGISGDIKLRGRDIQLRKELAAIDEWLATEERENPLSALETLHRREIAAASTMFMQGVLSYPADAKKFDPTISALVQLCRICDLPIVEYPDGIELFRCETQEIDQRYLAYRVTVYCTSAITRMIMRTAPKLVKTRAQELEALHGLGLSVFTSSLGFELAQIE
jgi:hypothetical protein